MTRRFVDYLLRNLQGMVGVERSFEDVKDIADNIAVVAALLLQFLLLLRHVILILIGMYSKK